MTAIDFPYDKYLREEIMMKEFTISLENEQKNIDSSLFAILVRNKKSINPTTDILWYNRNKLNGVEIVDNKDIKIDLTTLDLEVERIIIGSVTDNEEQRQLNVGLFKGFVCILAKEKEILRLDLKYLGGDSVCKYFEFIKNDGEWSCIVNTNGYPYGDIETLLKEDGYTIKEKRRVLDWLK